MGLTRAPASPGLPAGHELADAQLDGQHVPADRLCYHLGQLERGTARPPRPDCRQVRPTRRGGNLDAAGP